MPSPSRTAAARALHAVFGENARVPEGWNAGLAPADAALAQAMLGLAVRRWGRLQAFVEPKLKTPGRGLPLGSRVALALGLAQLAWLPGVADFAAVSEAVELAADRELGFPPHKGLANAILRAAAKDREGLARALDALPAALDRTPFAEKALDAACVGGDREALWARLQAESNLLFRELVPGPRPGLEPDPDLPGALRLTTDAAFPRAWLAAGKGMVQDRSSQALMAFAWEGQPRRILDACAAPGGKTTSLALRYPDAELYAVEKSPKRAERLVETLALRGVAAKVVVEDAGAWLRQGGKPFDLILLDAPCSASGTLRKHPELAWIGGAIDLPRLAALQRDLLEAALPRLALGGLLIYAVCSVFPAEGEAHRAWMAQAHPEFEPVAAWPEALGGTRFRPDLATWDGEGFQAFAWTLPAER
jgi:16S rRNA (cytosine967-C5)-methyltransferase